MASSRVVGGPRFVDLFRVLSVLLLHFVTDPTTTQAFSNKLLSAHRARAGSAVPLWLVRPPREEYRSSVPSRGLVPLVRTAVAWTVRGGAGPGKDFPRGCSLRQSQRRQCTLLGATYINGDNSGRSGAGGTGGEDDGSGSDAARGGIERQRQQRGVREGRTGWNHNLPSDTSDFWQSSSSGQDKPTTRRSSSSGAESSPRTGWLHNQVSPSEEQEKKKALEEAVGSGSTGASPARRRLQLAMKQQQRNHRLVAGPTFHSTGTHVTMVTEHLISVPLNRNVPMEKGQRIDVFFTIVEKLSGINEKRKWETLLSLPPNKRGQAYVQQAAMDDADSLILYLQGGPGFGAPTPVASLAFSKNGSWAAKALETTPYSRVVLMDQRGTGRSTPITKQTLELAKPDLFLLEGDEMGHYSQYTSLSDVISAAQTNAMDEQAKVIVQRFVQAVDDTVEYLSCFRADNIVKDAEDVRDALLLSKETAEDEVKRPWGCVLGQSFGGFCVMTYLSQIQFPPRICLMTGGVAPMLTPIDDVYRALWERVKRRNLAYYEMYPGDIRLVKEIVQTLLQSPAKLPSGGILTARRFLQLGLGLGSSPTSFASLHALLSTALISKGTDDHGPFALNRAFLKQIESVQSFDDHPIYFWLHESIYADSSFNSPTNWSAHRVYEEMLQSRPEFSYTHTSANLEDNESPTLFFGEMVFPWMVEDYGELRGVGLRIVAEALATKADWTSLYNEDTMRSILRTGACQAAAAVYYDDMYVDFHASATVFDTPGPLSLCKVWISNEYQHSGLRDDGARIFERLYGMATGSVRIPS